MLISPFIWLFYIVHLLYGIIYKFINKNNNPGTLKYRAGVRRGIVRLMRRKNSSALGGSLPRGGVSIKTLVGGNHKAQPQIE